VNENFTAIGNRRNGETWSGAPTTADQTAIDAKSRWGYGGHTAIGDHMGLVHMGGRIEDAVLGRFLSADPRGVIPGSTQSWNRYSYVSNNPLTFVDPTGFDSDTCDGCDEQDGSGGDGGTGGGAGGGSDQGGGGNIPEVVVNGQRPGTTFTNFAPGGYVADAPDGSQEIFGVAHRPSKASSGIPIQTQGAQSSSQSPCPNLSTFFYGVQASLIPGIGGQVSAGNYASNDGAKGSFVSLGGGAGFNIGADAFAGYVNGGPNVLRGRTDAVTIGLAGISINLIFKPDSAFNSKTFLGATIGPGADVGLSFSKDNTFLIGAQSGSCPGKGH
jgi:RHS repeat-associated protein